MVETESGSRYLIDLTAMTAIRLPTHTGGTPLAIEVWPPWPTSVDGRLRRDEDAVDMLNRPRPWPPVVGESLHMLLSVVHGVVTARVTTPVVSATEVAD